MTSAVPRPNAVRRIVLLLLLFLSNSIMARPLLAEPLDDHSEAIVSAMKSVVEIRGLEDVERVRRGEAVLATGSGVIISPDGLVVTNAHVVAKVTRIRAKLANGRSFTGRVIGRDARTDIAVIRLDEPTGIVAATIGDPAGLLLAAPVYALGSPMGQSFAVTGGILGGRKRAYDEVWPVDFLQHDAALNPGSSGGPLVDGGGRVIGINTATPPETLFDIGIAYAIPIDRALKVAKLLASEGKVRRGRLGLKVSTLDSAMAAALGAPGRTGLIIDEVVTDGPAYRAGLCPGDAIFAVAGQPVEVARDLAMALVDSRAGERIELTVLRDGSEQKLSLTLGEEADNAGAQDRAAALDMSGAATSGGEPYEPGITLGEDAAGAIVIAEVEDMSAAQSYGIYAGDRLIAINGRTASGAAEARAMLAEIRSGVIVLLIERREQGSFHVVLPADAGTAAARRPGSQRRFPQGPY